MSSATSDTGVLANFFNSLLNKKTTTGLQGNSFVSSSFINTVHKFFTFMSDRIIEVTMLFQIVRSPWIPVRMQHRRPRAVLKMSFFVEAKHHTIISVTGYGIC